MTYRLFFEERALKELAKIDKPFRLRIKEKLLALAADYERFKGSLKRLKGKDFGEYERLRVGDYRVIFRREAERLIIVVVRIGHRKEVY